MIKINEDFTIIQNLILGTDKLNIYEKMTYIILCAYDNRQTRECYPTVLTLAKGVGASKGTIKKSLKGLQEKGLIDIHHRKIGSTNQSNIYTLLDLPLWLEKSTEDNQVR